MRLENIVAGEVITHTFLGPVTRLKVIGPACALIADMPTARAQALPVGSRVVAHIPNEGARLINLPPEGPGTPEPGADHP